MKYFLCKGFMCLAAFLAIVAIWPAQSYAADPYTYKVVSVSNSAPGQIPTITFLVTNNSTGQPADLLTDPAWTQTAPPPSPTAGASRLFLQIAWDTRDFNNTNSLSNTVTGGRGAAMPIPVNALVGESRNSDGSYNVTSPLPIPASATGTGEVAMEGHPAGLNTTTGLWSLRVPVKSVYKYFVITGTAVVPRRNIVEVSKCMVCHGNGTIPRLTLHGSNRTEEPQVCVVCHNPNNTDIPFRGLWPAVQTTTPYVPNPATNPTVTVGSNTYPEQGIDFKRLVHGIHATRAGFRRVPFRVVGFNGTLFDASTSLTIPFPASLRNCVLCHIDNGTSGTFELKSSGPPLGPDVLASTMNTQSERNPVLANGTFVINTDPADNRRISPTAAVCSSCHDGGEVLSHMVSTGGASFNTTQGAINLGAVRERCNSCHGPGKDKDVRRVHLSSDD